jgi:hypothetical protein
MTPPGPQPPPFRRVVYHLGGYDPVAPADQHRRFTRELARFARTWNLRAQASPLRLDAGVPAACWRVDTTGPNWRSETTYRVLRWDDIVRRDMARSGPMRLARALVSLADFVLTGTVARYFHRRWPYALFFCFPFAALALFAAVGVAVGFSMKGPGGWAAGAAIFIALYAGPGRWWRVPQALDDWDFARNFVHGRRPETTARLEDFAGALLVDVKSRVADEILLVGHSFGATLMLEVVVRALEREPQIGACEPPVRLLTVGATIPKLGLHPRGERVRAGAERVAASAGIDWAEYQACDDPISFYKIDPRSLRRQRHYASASRPLVRRVHVREMLSPEIYHRFRHRFVRLHYQFLMANDVRARYDFFMFACGPLRFSDLVAARGGPMDFFAADGSLLQRSAAMRAGP